MARRLLTDPAPELRGSFEELVFQVGAGLGGPGWLLLDWLGLGLDLAVGVLCVECV